MAKVKPPIKQKDIETPEKLLSMWEDYKQEVKSNPRYRYVLNQRSGLMVAEPLERPLTQQGFEAFCTNKYKVTVSNYFDNTYGAYDAYYAICTHIVKERTADQIEGGMVGQYNASITQRLNGLVDKSEVDAKVTNYDVTLDLDK